MVCGTAQYASIQSQSDLASVRRERPDSVQVGTVRGEAAIPVLHGTRPGGDTGTALRCAVLRSTRPYNPSLIWLRRPYSVQVGTVRGEAGTPVSYCYEWYCTVRIRTIPVWFGSDSPRAARFRTVRYALRRGGDIGTALRRGVLTNTGQYCYQAVPQVQDAAIAASSVRLFTRHYIKVPSSTRSVAQSSAVPVITADPVPACMSPEVKVAPVLTLTR